MTKTPAPDAAVPVIQADRDAAKRVLGDSMWAGIPEHLRDSLVLVQELARHRLAALAPAGGEAAMRETCAKMFDDGATAILATRDASPFHSVSHDALTTYAVNLSGWARQIRELPLLAAAPPPPTSEPGADVDARAGGLEDAALYHDRKAQKWKKEAARHTRKGGYGSDCEQRDLERARQHRQYAIDLRAIAAALSTSTAAGEVDREALAEIVYDAMVVAASYPGKMDECDRVWRPRGNSHAQHRAREAADAIIAALAKGGDAR